MISVTLYHRQDCHLCEEVIGILDSLQKEFPHRLIMVDIEQDPQMEKQYGLEIPVLRIENQKLKPPISEIELRKAFKIAVQSKNTQSPDIFVSSKIDDKWTNGDKFSLWLSKHYMALINLIVLLFIGIPFLAPVFMKIGWETPATVIYRVYGTTCHQLAYRSIFLFGDQVIYPREAAQISGIDSFSGSTSLGEGNSPEEIWAARNYVGNKEVGFKVAVCQRDIAIYFGILLFNFIFIATGKKLNPLHWALWILIGLLPVGVDGLSQLLSQPPLSFIPYRESTLFLRFLTGFLFGFTTAWFGIPHVARSMDETREFQEQKKIRIAEISPT